jgi:uncharacterized protein
MSRHRPEATVMRTVIIPSAGPAHAAQRRGAWSRETVAVLVALALIALHVIDDNFLQPQPGMSPGDHLVSGLVPLALLGLAAWAYPRLRGGSRGTLALLFGVLGILGGIEAAHYIGTVGPSGDDFTGLLSAAAGLLLLGIGAVTLWRTRRTEGNRAWRYARRGLLGAATLVVATAVLLPFGLAYIVTHTARAVVPPNHLGVAYEDVRFKTSDGLELEGWYVPSRNGAAVIAFPGRSGPQKQTRMLARHGYGVLLFDRRGEGDSEGEPNIFGWGGERDIKAAIAYLQDRPDVDSGRIGGIGLSVGGEMMLEAAAETDELAAVVSEGAGPRAYSDEMDQELSGSEKLQNSLPSAVKTASLALFTNQAPPANLKDLVGRIAPRPILLIAAPNSPNGEDLNRGYYEAAGEPKELWEIPESKHVGGLAARPQEYERRVIGFFDAALRP